MNSYPVIPVNGLLHGKPVDAIVDHILATRLLTSPDDPSVIQLFKEYSQESLHNQLLLHIARKYSPDVSSLYFIQRVYQVLKNRISQDRYQSTIEQLKRGEAENLIKPVKSYLIVFIPGFDYKDDPSKGADFARQRKLFSEYGIQNLLIETNDWGTADENSIFIAKELSQLTKKHDSILIVSASKGGLDVAIALGKHINPLDTKSIKGWISIGGILRGSPIADWYLSGFRKWFAWFKLRLKGRSLNVVRDISYIRRSNDFLSISFPSSMRIFHVVGLPLTHAINKKIKSRYQVLLERFGPNDGLTTPCDQISETGTIVTELGLDHFFKDADIDRKTLALALTAVHEIEA